VFVCFSHVDFEIRTAAKNCLSFSPFIPIISLESPIHGCPKSSFHWPAEYFCIFAVFLSLSSSSMSAPLFLLSPLSSCCHCGRSFGSCFCSSSSTCFFARSLKSSKSSTYRPTNPPQSSPQSSPQSHFRRGPPPHQYHRS